MSKAKAVNEEVVEDDQNDDKEEEEDDDDLTDLDGEVEDDPIVKRIPLFFNSNPDFTLPSFAHFQPSLDIDEDDEDEGGKVSNQKSSKPENRRRNKPLTLIQYPFKLQDPKTQHVLLPPSLRPENNNGDSSAQINAKFKPGVRHLQLEVPLEIKLGTLESRFSEDRARGFGKGLASSSSDFKPKNINNMLDEDFDPINKVNYSSNLVPEQTNYVVGLLKRGKRNKRSSRSTTEDNGGSYGEENNESEEIHLVPLDQTIQMRPDLDYLDKLDALNAQADKISRNSSGNNPDGSESEDDSDGGEEQSKKKTLLSKKKSEAIEARSIQVSVNNSSDPFGNGMRGGLFAPLRAAEAETPINLTHYHCQTKESEAIKQKIYVDERKKLIKTSSWKEVLKV